jgi:cobalt-zinc-cadmium efflux system outer membrane protein
MSLGLLFLSGCLYQVREQTDRVVSELAAQPYDLQRREVPEKPAASPSSPKTEGSKPVGESLDIQTSALMDKARRPEESSSIRQVSLMQAESQRTQPGQEKDKVLEAIRRAMEKLRIPEAVPGSETPLIEWPITDPKGREALAKRQEAVAKQLYPPLPELPEDPKPQPGPNGRPYTLADLQQIAAANSPELRQAASDVEAARGAYKQARTYPNPTGGYEAEPSSNGSTPGLQGFFFDQVIRTGGKLKFSAAAAWIDLQNAELALRRARSDLATRVRNAYYAVLVAQEAVRVNKALAIFTDKVYRVQAEVLQGGLAAPYEPATLRAQAWTVRLAYQQAIATYIYAWKQLVSIIGLRQLPLSEVGGRIDRLIPYYDYDAVLAHVLRNHTDVLTARNVVEKAHFNRMLAQVTPAFPDVELRFDVIKDFVVAPRNVVGVASVSFPLPIWDQNVGNIMSAEAAEVRASEESHRVEMALTSALSTAYMNYKTNLEALEYYRKYILPDQVTNYRGVFDRRRIDPTLAFIDLVTAQQTLASSVSTYLGILGTLWTSVVSVADLQQTNDLFQLGEPREVPALPDLESLPGWFCPHPATTPAVVGQDSNPVNGPTRLESCPTSGTVGQSPSGNIPATPSEVPGLPAVRPLNPARNLRFSHQGRVSDIQGERE